jgi:hypothetical protein
LQVLDLSSNKIRDGGVASIGDALAYVQSRHLKNRFEFIDFVFNFGTPPDLSFFGLIRGHYQDVYLFIDLQLQFDVDHTWCVCKPHECHGAKGD